MSKKRIYSDDFKSKVILELLREEETVVEIASKHQVHATTIREWKREFLANMPLAINPEKGLEKYKEQVKSIRKENEDLYKEIGMISAQLSWAKKKIEEYGL